MSFCLPHRSSVLRILAAACTAACAACGSSASEITSAEHGNIEESSTEALQSANDAANSSATASATISRAMQRTVTPTSAPLNACLTGTVTDSPTSQDANTTVHNLTYSACEVRAGHTWNGNQTITVETTGATTTTVTVVNALTESIAKGEFAGDEIIITTTTPIIITVSGLASSGTVTRTLSSGVDHRERHGSAGALQHSVDVTFQNLSVTDTFGAAAANGEYPLVTRVASGGQSVHHLLWKVTVNIVHDATTWQPASCSCTPVSGGGAHTFVWDDGSRTLALTRNNVSCGDWTITGTDTKNHRTIDEVFTATCP